MQDRNTMSSLDAKLASLRLPREDIAIATKDFAEENMLKRGRKADVYKGLLLRWSEPDIAVVIRRYAVHEGKDRSIRQSKEMHFLEKIDKISDIRHRNVASFIGFCDEKGEKMIVMENVVNGSLEKYLSDPTFAWSQILHICFGAALALRYSHEKTPYFCKGGFKILLDEDWDAKVLLCIDSDSEYSNVYAFGVTLLEVLYGRKSTSEDVNQYLAKMALNHEQLDDIIPPNLRTQMHTKSLSILSEIAYSCLKEQPDQQPTYMFHKIVERVYEAFEVQWKHEHLSWVKKFAYMKIPLSHIKLATNDFAIKSRIYECLYKGELGHFDRGSVLTTEKENKSEPPAKAVIINRSYKYLKKPKDFFAEIEMLANCKHSNLLSFLGFCDDDSEMILVFEGAKETLNDYLSSESNMIKLTWEQRIHICLDIAHGLNHVHNIEEEGKPSMIHHVIQSVNVFLDENWTAKIANIMLPKFDMYPTSLWDSKDEPQIPLHQTLNVAEDIYALGVILFEILIGRRLYYYESYMTGIENGFESTVLHLDENKLMSMADPRIMEEAQYSRTFFEITYQCLAQTPTERPTLEAVIKSLEEALHFQVHLKKFTHLKIPLRNIKLATDNFSRAHLIKSHTYESVYKGELEHFDRGSVLTIKGEENYEGKLPKKTLVIKKINKYEKTPEEFFAEIVMLTNCKHPNILSFLGFCDEDSEMILIFEGAFKETLYDYLRSGSNRTNLTWEQRIRICLDIAHGLKCLQNMERELSMIHHVIMSVDVFLDEKLTAKIAGFRLSEFNSYPKFLGQSGQTLVEDGCYFLGVILVEILTGRLAYDSFEMVEENVSEFASMAQRQFNGGKLKNIADARIMEETQECSYNVRIGPNQDSFDTFSKIACWCLEKTPSERPALEVVIKLLEKALHFQVQNLEHLEIALSVIQLATKYFNKECLIGLGGYGEVYECSLPIKMKSKDGLPEMVNSTVAIKRIFSRDDGQGKEGFLAELDVLSRCEHPNIISLLGFCVEDNEMLLVYEHASNGSLDDYLGCTNKIINLTWAQRLKMCIDIAHGLSYLHTTMEEKRRIIHRDIKSANILLGKNWEAKIADFGLSKFHPANQQASTINTKHIAGTNVYLDPEYAKTGRLKKASDIYSFGVVLFEIFSGKLAYDSEYMWENGNGLAPIAQRHFEKGTLKEILDPNLMDEDHELSSTLRVGPDLESLNVFSKIAYQCLAKTQADRPTIEAVIKELKAALKFQENRKDTFKISLEAITLGVKDFIDDNLIIGGGYGMLYRGEVQFINGHKKVVVKRFHTSDEHFFVRELEVLIKHKQENIIGLLGYCKELDEKIIVYENASKGCLSSYLSDTSFSWSTRLKICIDIANGLNFLHGGDAGQDVVIHRDIKSSNILLTEDWKAKICGFEQSLTFSTNQETEYVMSDVGSPGYCDPLYWETGILTKESDIYSFGVILFEILCGRLACPEDIRDSTQFLDVFVKHHFLLELVDQIVYEGIKEQIVLTSLVTFLDIAFQCLHDYKKDRPTAGEVAIQLQKALEYQEAYEIWEAKLPRNYKEILPLSKSPEIFSTMAKKDIYNILSEGILLQDDKLWFSIGGNGERNEMITSTLFSFRNRWSYRRRSIKESRFHKVVEMSDVSNLNIQIKIRTQLLPLDVKYSVHLVFKFCGPRKSHAKRVYVNLKYKMGNKRLHAYFATWREDDWMMIELCRFSNLKKDTTFEVLLEGFSRCYCDSSAIYIEGIEFRAIDNAKQEKVEKLEENQQVLPSLSEMKREVYHMVSAESVVYDFTNSKSPAQSRDEQIYKVPRQSVFCIMWYINEYQMMSPNTECACYLVFKLSENCHGLHCPVIVRDQFHWKSKEIIYFRSPSPWNLHDSDRVPKKRRDGWMEVIVSKFNSDFVTQRGCLSGKLKLISYQGTMSGLIIRGLEFRPMEE